ncbi:MAG: hypothetical protein CL947_03915 [Epsilonproteobacteria bacterium]|nr:hypothetical protein [Campylobacterota bacterium]
MGPPGSGKGTLSALCVERFGWYQLSTGNLCRDHIQKNTDLGKQIKEAINKGELVNDHVIADMVKEWIVSQDTMPEAIIFDGYPRTKTQAELLYKLLQDVMVDSELVLIKLHVDADIIAERILSRVSCSNKKCQRVYSLMNNSQAKSKSLMICDDCKSPLKKRSDDTQDALKNRIQIYYNHEQEILNFYVNKGMNVGMINAAQTVQDVFNDFTKFAEHKDYVC